MTYLQATWYGILQGITEFLPISSSAHLVILPKFLNIEDPGVFFDLGLHIGTLLAILIYFRTSLIYLFKNILREWSLERKINYLALNLMISLFVTVILAVLLKKLAILYGRNHQLIAFNLIFWGGVLYLFDQQKWSGKIIFNMKEGRVAAALVGLMQAIAIFPGVSRSGITMATARWQGASREESANFSFLLSVPVIAGAALVHLPEIFSSVTSYHLPLLSYTILISTITGLLSIHFLLKIFFRFGFLPFAIYRIFLAILLFTWI